jgi:hypothetical protein
MACRVGSRRRELRGLFVTRVFPDREMRRIVGVGAKSRCGLTIHPEQS